MLPATAVGEDPPDRLGQEVEWQLTWRPPGGWRQYEELVIPAGGGVFTLNDSKNYRISAPQVIRGAVDLRGGRNVVWIGGEWDISGFPTPAGSALDRRALVIRDTGGERNGRVVHLEGLLMGGEDLSEGIDIAAPSAIVQIENVHVAGVYLRGADDRDGTGPYDVPGWSSNHADILQPWGGFKEIRIDGLTGHTMYQGFYYVDDLGGTGNSSRTYLRRVNLEAIRRVGPDDGYSYAGHKLFRWDPSKTGQVFVDNGTVWARHNRYSSWALDHVYRHAYRDTRGVLVPDPSPGTAVFTDAFYPLSVRTGNDKLGRYAWWSQKLSNGLPAIRNWFDSSPGRFYSGAPAGGDYVPASSVGRGYRSPGYMGDTGGLECNGLQATILGTAGPDTITGTSERDVIVAGTGNDVIDGLAGNDVICAGPGRDVVDGGYGADMIWGGPGDDRIRGSSGRDWLFGGSDEDRLVGGARSDWLIGNEGNDTLRGNGAADVLRGGHRRDALFGGKGDDRMWGGSGGDRLDGQEGVDSASGGGGTDTCDAEISELCEL